LAAGKENGVSSARNRGGKALSFYEVSEKKTAKQDLEKGEETLWKESPRAGEVRSCSPEGKFALFISGKEILH